MLPLYTYADSCRVSSNKLDSPLFLKEVLVSGVVLASLIYTVNSRTTWKNPV